MVSLYGKIMNAGASVPARMSFSKIGLVLLFVLLVSFLNATTGIDIIGKVRWDGSGAFDECGVSQYFDSLAATCRSCIYSWAPDDDGYIAGRAVPDYTHVDPAGQALGCKCPLGYKETESSCATDDTDGSCQAFSCDECDFDNDYTSYSDNTGCAPCGSSTQGVITDDTSVFYLTCGCGQSDSNSYMMLLEKNITGVYMDTLECVTCADGTGVIVEDTVLAGRSYKADLNACQSCPDPKMEMTFASDGTPSCACKTGYDIGGIASIGEQYCIHEDISQRSYDGSVDIQLDGEDTGSTTTVNSKVLEHYYAYAASRCLYHKAGDFDDQVACQILANLCVANLYATDSQPCETMADVISARGTDVVRDIETWYRGFPWITYAADEVESICLDTSLKDRMTFDEKEMNFWVSKYTLNGTWAGLEQLDTHMMYCKATSPRTHKGGGTGTSTRWQVFGATETLTAECDLSTLFNQEQFFYDMFYQDKTGGLYPVPVRLPQYAEGSKYPNVEHPQNQCELEDVLFRRFFLFDRYGGITDTSDDDSVNNLHHPQYIRYASSINLEVRLRDDEPTKIYAPVLTITYDGREVSDGGKQVPYEFTMRYTQDLGDFFITLEGFFIATATIFGLLCMMRGYNYNGRNSRPIIDASQVFTGYAVGMNLRTAREGIAIILNAWVIMFFPFVVMLCWYFFVFFKLQGTVSVMLPPMLNIHEYDSPYYGFTVMVHILAIFQLVHVLNLIYRQVNADIFFLDWEKKRSKGKREAGSVSVWRTITAANEWNEMLTMRRTNINFTLFWIGFFLIGLKLDYNATQQPDIDDLSQGELNVILRFANTAWWWLILSAAQLLWNWLIWQRFYDEPPEQKFVDMCTIGKISMLVLLEPYYGYYVHCRSPHQFADGTMTELVEMLHQEEAGLTVDRALEGAPPDVQSFEIFLSAEWRIYFDKIYTHFDVQDKRGWIGALLGNCTWLGGTPKRTADPKEQEGNARALDELTSFMADFIDNNFGRVGLRRRVYEPSYSAQLFKNPPPMGMGEQPCTFICDKSWNFTKATFLGIEADLLVLDILLYSLYDLWFNDTMTSILLTYLSSSGLCMVRGNFGKTVLAAKTMIDERFLM